MSVIRKSTIKEIVYERITQMLFDGLYPPGAPITRKEIAGKLGVSPTPVGEAISRLVGEGIIEQTGRAGYRITDFSYENLEALYMVRTGIEGIAIRLCIEKADEQVLEDICSSFDDFLDSSHKDIEISHYLKADQRFHRMIVQQCGNPYIISYNKSYVILLRGYQKGLLRFPGDTITEHRDIITSIVNRDAQSAQVQMTEH